MNAHALELIEFGSPAASDAKGQPLQVDLHLKNILVQVEFAELPLQALRYAALSPLTGVPVWTAPSWAAPWK